MKDTKTFIAELNELGVKLWTDGDRLRFKVPKAQASLLSSLRSELLARKANIIDYLNRNRVSRAGQDVILRLSGTRTPKPSPAQQRLWFLSELEGVNAIYNIVSVYRLVGDLDDIALRSAFKELVRRHDSLRQTFPTVDGKPSVSEIPPYDPLTLDTFDGLNESGDKKDTGQWINTHAREPFDLAEGPLFRVRLLRMSDHEQFLLFNMHHIISDAWSMEVLIRDLGLLYNACTENASPSLPELDAGFLDYTAWKQDWFTGTEQERQLAYWTRQLEGIPELLELPADFSRPARMRYRGGRLIQRLPSDLTGKIKQLGRKTGVTDFMLLLSAFNLLLYRYTGKKDIVVGSPIANRTHPQTEQMVGLMANTLAYRTRMDGEMTFTDLLAQVKQTALEAFQHQDLPFEVLVEKINPTRSMSHSPLYQVMFMLQNVPEEGFKLKGLDMTPVAPDHTTARLDLTLEIVEDARGFNCGWEFNTDLFLPETIARMTGHLQVLLEGALTHPDLPVSRLPMLTAEEIHQWRSWNDTDHSYPENKTLVDLFEQKVRDTPDAVALVCEDRSASFCQLNRAANRLAFRLTGLGVRTGTLVGICTDRSMDMLVGLLGILKAGGAYVPLDPDYPIARLQDIMEDADFPVMVSQRHIRERFSALPEQVICLDEIGHLDETGPDKAAWPDRNPPRQAGPDGLAYVIYTSGSTGKPKGVMIGHRAMVNFLGGMQQFLRFTPEDRMMALTTISFDIAVLELFSPLITGGRSVLVSRETASDPDALMQTMADAGITHMQATPATWKLLAQNGWQQTSPLTALTGGEALPARLGQTLLKNSRRLWNVYGPTETTVWSAFHGSNQTPDTPELIGCPIANTQIFILDDNRQPVPRGIPGELCIGGHGLAEGYLNRPNLTADRFVETEIFGKVRRIYRTGDLARLRRDGHLEYLGRLDHQVKLRGFRIELAEIEIVLGRHTAVKEAVVVLDSKDHPRLVAYVTQAAPIADAASVLRTWLKDRLPEYMVPAVFMVMDRLPLTPNGKIDRNALPAPAQQTAGPQDAPPRTPAERCLVKVWCQVLKQANIGIHDNFFELGGDSILSVQIVSGARAQGFALKPRDLFLHQTIAELAPITENTPEDVSRSDQGQACTDTKGLAHPNPPVAAALLQQYGDGVEAAYPLSPMQKGMLFHTLKDPDGDLYYQQFHCRLRGCLDTRAFKRAWQAMVDRHDTLRTAFVHDSDTPLQLVMKTAELSWEDLDWRGRTPEEISRRFDALLEDQRTLGFDLTRPPLMRLQLIREQDEMFRLVWHHHHLLMDGWCFPILFSEMFKTYDAILNHRPLRLPELPPYRLFIDWIEGCSRSDARSHWQTHLEGISAPTPLPFGKSDSPFDIMGQKSLTEISLSAGDELTGHMNRFCRTHRLTLNTLVQGAWACLLSRFAPGENMPVVFGVTTSGREVPIRDIDKKIGLFINTLPLKVTPGGKRVVAYLQQIQADQQDNNQFAYASLSDIQQWSGVPGGTPLFESLVVFENYPLDDRLKDEDFTGALRLTDFDGTEQTNYPLTLAVLPQDPLLFRLSFDNRRFDRERMDTLLAHLKLLLAEMAAHPEESVNRLAWLTNAEVRRLRAWNDTRRAYPRNRTIVDLFRDSAIAHSDAVAVVSGETALTYSLLDRKTDQLARYLKHRGVGPETLAGLLTDRSSEFIIGVLGIMKAGGAYVPMDTSFPDTRIGTIIGDAAISLVVTKSEFLDKLPDSLSEAICLDRDNDRIAAVDPAPFPCPAGPSNLAYVIYTSGSTGTPKGVMVEHRGLVNLIHGHIEAFSITRSDRSSMLASPAFDASGWEMWPYLCTGGRVYPMPADILSAPVDKFKNFFEKHRITVAYIPPALLETLFSDPWESTFLSRVHTGGDVLHSYPPSSCPFRLWNVYGPTEATVAATAEELPAAGPGCPEGFPGIGRPLANTRVYIMTPGLNPENLQVLPPGLPGELCIAGDGLARGYLNRPDLTREKFVEVEISGKRQRIYRTGDAARFRQNGTLQYLGRLDNQISLRGYRIEPSEIETHLRQHKLVKDAVVMARQAGGSRSGYLAAYITLKEPYADTPTAIPKTLTAWLKNRLPAYMIPAKCMVLDRLPITPNGKIDRNALPEPGLDLSETLFEAPRTDTEERLLKVWKGILTSDDIGIHDNYFDLGGDSILSIQIVARARTEGLVINPGDLFRHPTVAELSRVALPAPSAGQKTRPPAAGALPLAPIQQRFFDARRTRPWHYNQSVLLTVPGEIDAVALKAAYQRLLDHHDALRLRFKETQKGWTARYADSEQAAWHEEDLNSLSSAKDLACAILERTGVWQERLNFEDGPLSRMILFRFGNQARLFWCIHHLAVDGISWRILMEDLKTAYLQIAEGNPVSLPEKTDAYQAWTRRLTGWEVGGQDYFRQLPAAPPLPADCPETSSPFGEDCHHTIYFSRETTGKLLTHSPKAFRARINDVLLTALAMTLREWTYESGWLIDTESHGRTDLFDDIDISRTVGWFTALYPLFLDLPSGADPETALKHVKEQLRQVPDDGVGYGVMRWINGEALPQGRILFNYLGQFSPWDAASDWQLAPEETGTDACPQTSPDYLIEINGRTVDGRLSLTWAYHTGHLKQDTVAGLAEGFRHHLKELIALCTESCGYTPSDFPLAALPQADLDRMAARYGNTIADIYPLSPMQQGMLFHTLRDPENGTYFEQFHGLLSGKLNPTAFRSAWEHLVQRHAILRTGISHDGDTPVQVVFKSAPLAFDTLDWRDSTESERAGQLDTLLLAERARGFDLERAPLLRIHLIREERDSHRLVLHHHHLLLDGWCLPLLFTELFEIYQALLDDEAPVLPPVPAYRTYIQWLAAQENQAADAHWQTYLAGVSSPTALPKDPDRPEGHGPVAMFTPLDPELTERLQDLSRQHRLTLSTIFQGAWAALLSLYSGDTDVVFGVTSSGRQVPVPGIDRMLGLFINTLPLRITTDKGSGLQVLKQIQDQQQQSAAFAHTALSRVQNLAEVPNGTPLFDTIMVFENYPVDDTLKEKQGGIEISGFTGIEYTNYPISLSVMPGDEILMRFTYDSNRFSSGFMDTMASRLMRLLNGVATRPDLPFHDLQAMDDRERENLQRWQNGMVLDAKGLTVIDLFQAQVEKTPETTAVVFKETAVTYRELNHAVNRLARYLRSKGVGRETLVGICLHRSVDMVTALLGVLKAGGAYLPLDPEYPAARLDYMMSDAGVSALITHSGLREGLPAAERIIEMDRVREAVTHLSPENPENLSDPDHLAYTIFTSGSTGKPKGVAVEHGALMNHMAWMQETFAFTAGDRFLQKTPFSFDPSVWEFYQPLMIGATLVMAEPGGHRDPDYLLETIRQEQITVLRLVPSLLKLLIQARSGNNRSRDKKTPLRYMLCGGEPLGHDIKTAFYDRFPDTRLYNLYGPTEATIVASGGYCPKDSPAVDIGRPVANTRIYILDRHHHPLPPGIPGELCIAGKSLARGYLNHADLTAERFVEARIFGEVQRIYKTRDLARWTGDGRLEYLGRTDHQVKLRGMRIELSEIDVTLSGHYAVKDAATRLTDTDPPSLAAYVVLNDQMNEPVTEADHHLKVWLKERLPGFMVPTSITMLDTLPLTPSGKIDRNALPAPDLPAFTRAFTAPRTRAERRLLDLWRDILDQPDLGIFDNFFEQGGDSILSIRIAAKARDHGMDLRPGDIFDHQTVAELAPLATPLAHRTPCDQGPMTGEVPLAPIQKRFFQRGLKAPGHYTQAILLALPEDTDASAMAEALSAVLDHHDALRLRFKRHRGRWTGKASSPGEGEVPFHVEDLRDLPSETEENHALAHRAGKWQSGFDLESGPLVRLVLFRMKNRLRLLWCIHHLVVDGVSWRILLEDLEASYLQAVKKIPIHLPEKTDSYKTWTSELRKWQRSDTFFEEEAGYWQQLPKAPPIPLDIPDGTNRLQDAVTMDFSLSPGLTRRLLTEAHTAYRTQINDILLTALMLTLREWTGDSRALIDLEGHGRTDLFDDIDLSRTVGWFTAIHPAGLALPQNGDAGAALKRVKEQLRQIPNGGTGYGVARWLGQSDLPQGQVLFNYMGRFDRPTRSSQWQLAPESAGDPLNPEGPRPYLIEINSQTVNDCFSINWTFSRSQYRSETIHRIGRNYLQHLEDLIEHCADARGYTPSDFPLADTDQAGLDLLTQRYGGNIADIYPLSPMQTGMLFHSLSAPDEGVYVEQRHCLFKGDMDVDAFGRAWQHLIRRHTILRTAVCHDLGAPLQIVLKTAELPLQTLDWRRHSPNLRQQQLDDLLQSERARGFDPGQAPLMRLQMIREADDTWRMVWHHHHLLMDGWCLPILFTELFEAYTSMVEGQPPELPQVQPYQNYIAWLCGQDPKAAQAYWETYLNGFEAPTPLPQNRNDRDRYDRNKYDQVSGNSSAATRSLAPELTRELTRFSRNCHLTLNTLVQGAWATLLSRYTGQAEVVFGVTTSGRQAPVHGIDRMMGLFINTLPLRVRVKGESVFDLLDTVQKDQQENDRFAHTALSDIQRWSDVPKGSALFETILVFENYPVDENIRENHQGGLAILDAQGIESNNYPMTLVVIPEKTVRFQLSYDSGRFDPEEMEDLLAHFERLLTAMAKTPDRPCSHLPMLSPTEEAQQVSWNDAPANELPPPTIVEMFETRAQENPDHTALEFETGTLNYGDLNARSNRLARHLRNLGTGPDTLVGICMDRSLEMITAIMGILKAGGAYLPLDPSYPSSRLAFMLSDASVTLVLTRSQLMDRLPAQTDLKRICTDTLDRELAGVDPSNLSAQSAPYNLAYVIYTSGSTGTPKGCQVTHANVTRLFRTTEQQFSFGPDDVWTLFHSYAFDFSVWEIFGALLYGGKLVIPSFHVTRNPEAFYQLLIHRKVTVLNQTPSAFTQLNRVDAHPADLSLRLVIFGGEALDFGILTDWYSRHDDRRPQMVNMYGLTETTVHVTYYPLTSADRNRNNRIGTPIADLEAWILDDGGMPLPVGVPGELYVAGAGLARGYLNRPELTAERFVHLKIFDREKRLYRTGDLVRRRSDGQLEYLGRMDHQVKLRGFRIELPEIEAALKRHENVYEAAVVLSHAKQSPRLAAFVTLSQARPAENETTPDILRRWLQNVLPDHMIPAGITLLDRFPLTPNGKIDRKALPNLETTGFTRGYEAPRTETEYRLLEVWRKVLDQPEMGIYDNFFEQGGDSILSIQIVARARARGVEISPKDLFDHQTVAALSPFARPRPEKPVAEQGRVTGNLPLSPIQRRFFNTIRHNPNRFNQAVMLEVPRDIQALALKKALAHLIAHHDALRLRFRDRDGVWTAGHTEKMNQPWHTENLSGLPDRISKDKAMARCTEFYQASLDLSAGPLMRMVLFQSEDRTRLFWCIHHLVVDGVSWRILLEDLQCAYEQALAGKPLRLPDKTSSYQLWAKGLRQWYETETKTPVEANYWRNLPRPEPLPVDHPDGPNRILDQNQTTIRFTAEQTRRLLKKAPAAYRTRINDLLLTALMMTLRDWTGRSSVLIDTESHGRTDLHGKLDLTRTVGWFTSLYAQPLCLPEKQDTGIALKAIKEQLRQVPNEGIGYGIRRWLLDEDLPRGQILFNYLGQFDTATSSSGWQFAGEETGQPADNAEERDYLIEINGRVRDARLSLTWTYSTGRYESQTVDRLAQGFRQHLEKIISHCETAFGYTPSDFALASLNQEQVDILARRYAGNIDQVYPLSPMQQGMLFHSLKTPDNGLYVEQMYCTVEGDLNIDAFHRGWQHMVDRHTLLRTAFCSDLDSPPLQVVLKTAELPWEVMDLRDLDDTERETRLNTLLESERVLGFDLEKAPLMRLHLIREQDDRWRMVWHHHHLLLDGWSLPLLFADLAEAYAAAVEDRTPRLRPVRPYQEYIGWLAARDHKKAADHWRTYLAGFSMPTPLPLPSGTGNTGDYQVLTHRLDSGLTRKLTEFGRTRHLTLNTLVQGAWATLLSRYSGETDVVFGVTTSGRQVPVTDIERMVGLFINTLPLRIDLAGRPILGVLNSIQTDQQKSNAYADTSLADIQSSSMVPNGIPLFDTILVFENYPVDETESRLPGSLRFLDVKSSEQTNYPLALAVIPSTGLNFKLSFDAGRFQGKDIERLLVHLCTLLKGIVSGPELDATQLPLMSASEIARIQSWNQTRCDVPSHKTVVDIFEDQAQRTPDHTAVVFEGQPLTYGELNARANALADELAAKSIGPDVLVGILMARSLEMVIALLGTLKAGGAYLPLDPDYPESRLRFMIEDAGVGILLSQSGIADALPLGNSTECICLDRGWGAHSCKDQNPARRSSPDHLAYAIYTSGSTGRPKGVAVEHRSLLNHMQWMEQTFSLTSEDRTLQKTPFSFDASVWEFYAPLLSGGTLVMAKPGGHKDPDYLLETIQTSRITVLQLVPSALEMIMDTPNPARATGLRYLFCGGEALPLSLAGNFMKHCPGTRLYNLYGPTEATIDATFFPVTPESRRMTIGRAIANTRIYILDKHRIPLPPGIAGELCIAGKGLARGYINAPDTTAEKFVDLEIFGRRERVYKTGDQARRLSDGTIEFLGRLDHQVKLRGFRIELREIETTLKEHEWVKDAAAIIHGEDGEARLAAYVRSPEPEGKSADNREETLLAWCRVQLPAHMVPVSLTMMDAFPQTPSGKVDRGKLPVPAARASLAPVLSPRNLRELRLAQIWESLLKVRHIGIRDNFFELGGHSILAVRLISLINKTFKRDLPLSALFKNPTIEGLSGLLDDTRQAVRDWRPLVPIGGDGDVPPLFCVHPAGGTVFCYYELAQHLGKDQPLIGLQAPGIEAGQSPLTRMEDIAGLYLKAIRSVQPKGPYRLAGWSFGGQAAFEMACQLQAEGESVSLLALLDSFMWAPDETPPEIPDDARLMFDLLTEMEVPVSLEKLEGLSPDEQLLYVKHQGTRVDYFPGDIDLGELRRLFRVYKANLAASVAYAPGYKFSGTIILFKATEETTGVLRKPDLGWTDLATEGVEVIPAAGHHHNMAQSPHVEGLAEKLKTYLKK